MARKQNVPENLTAPFLRRLSLIPERMDEGWPFNLPILQGGTLEIDFDAPITILVGENGAGKSTLMEALAVAAGFSVHGGGSEHSGGEDRDDTPLAGALRLSWLPRVTTGFFMRAESFFNFASYIDQAGVPARWGGRRLLEQSHGESFLALYASRLNEPGFYLMDEPEAALSPSRQLAFLCLLNDMEKTGKAQVIMATHSPILMAYPGAQLLGLDGDTIAPIDYRETEHYKLYDRFLRNPEGYLRHLFEEEDG